MVKIIFSPKFKNLIMKELEKSGIGTGKFESINVTKDEKNIYLMGTLEVDRLPANNKNLDVTDWEMLDD